MIEYFGFKVGFRREYVIAIPLNNIVLHGDFTLIHNYLIYSLIILTMVSEVL